MARILILGCGDVGNTLGRRLLGRGDRVWGLRRKVAALAQGIHPLAGDLSDPASLSGWPKALDAVVYTAAATRHDEAGYRAAYVTGVANSLKALGREGGAGRFLFVSSTGVYGQNDGQWVDEDSATEPAAYNGRLMLEGEALVRQAGGIAVRFGGIYGPGRRRLIDMARAGATCQAEPPLYTNRIHRDDCAGVLQHLIDVPEPMNVYNAVDREPAPQCEVLRWLAARLDAPRPEATAGRSGGGKRVGNRRLLASGYRFLYPGYRDGYSAVLDAISKE